MLTKVIDYLNPVDFNFDSSLISVTGGQAILKDQRPTGMTLGATFTTGINARWANGDNTGTAVNGATTASGELDLTGNTNQYLKFAGGDNFLNTQIGAFKFKYRPGYTTMPASKQTIFNFIQDVSHINNFMQLSHTSGGNLTLECYDSAGSILSGGVMDFGAWAPVSGTQYEIEIDFDFTSGATRLFIDGIQLGTTKTQTGIRAATATLIFIGSDYQGGGTPNFKLDDFIIFSAVQHTGDYSAGYSLSDTIYPVNNPVIRPTTSFNTEGLHTFTSALQALGSDAVKFILNVGGVDKWWNGTAWVTSDGTLSQSNSSAEISAHIEALDVSCGAAILLKALLHSADGSTTPTLSDAEIGYDYFAIAPTPIAQCYCYLRVEDILALPVLTATLVVESDKAFKHGNFLILPFKKLGAANADGYCEMDIIETATPGVALKFSLTYVDPNNVKVSNVVNFSPFVVPAQDSLNLATVLTVV